jgi:hypothetical protein
MTTRPFARATLLVACILAGFATKSSGAQSSDIGRGQQPVRSATASAAQKRVTIHLTDVRLEDVLQEIARQAGFGLSYRPDLPELDRHISLEVDSLAAGAAVQRALRGTRIEAVFGTGGRTLLLRTRQEARANECAISGIVRAADLDRPIATADVRIIAGTARTLTSNEGTFCLQRLSAGPYALEVGQLGYATARVDGVIVPSEDARNLVFTLTPVAIPLRDVVVTPAHFGIAHESINRGQTINREQIETLPQLGEDIYRTVNRLPGIASNEMSAKLTVRGGADESLLVLLDGLELYEPFHLKDFDGSLSILDVAAIGGVDLTTGGFASQYGNRLTGVFDLRTTNQLYSRPRTSIGLSLSNARIMSQGSFANGNGMWLFSARRGYLDILLKLIGEGDNVDPRYYDGLAKVVYQVSPKHRFTAQALRAGDTGLLVDDDGVGEITSNYGSTYAWLTWQADFTDRVRVATQLRTGALDWHRAASEHGTGNDYDLRDDRDFSFVGAKQDWLLSLSEQWVLKWGADLSHGNADYDYYNRIGRERLVNGSVVTTYDSTATVLSPSGSTAGLYLAQRVRPWSPLTIETGVRWDQQSYTSQAEWLPRVNAALAIDRHTTLRAAWGRYAQPHALFQLAVQDGVTAFEQAERAVQYVAGIERTLGAGLSARVEVYRRDESELRTRYRNLQNTIEPAFEVEADRTRFDPESARAQGIELLLQRHATRSSWSVSYALAHAYEVVDGIRIDRPLDQRHTFYSDYTFAPSPAWHLSWSWQYHSGWPITNIAFGVDTLGNGNVRLTRTFESPFADRLPGYHRMDLRATRTFDLKRGKLSVFLDVFNLYNRDNPQSYNYDISYRAGRLTVSRHVEPLLPRLPSLGATWEF